VRARGRLDAEESARICAQVARALEVAHRAGVVHRDIKSQNVLVTPSGEAKLTDFGIARLMAEEEAGLTRTGMMIGTSDYLAPEQARGHEVDGRTDVYALGIVLYECLTGELPFPADNPLAVALRHVQEPMPDPRAVAPDVPGPLAAAVLRAGMKEPEARFPSAQELAEALEEAPEAGTQSMPQIEVDDQDTGEIAREDGEPGPARRRWPWAAGGLALLAGGAVAALLATGVIPTGGGGGGGGVTTTPDGPRPDERLVVLPQQAVQDYDPDGGGTERGDLVPLAYDGDPQSFWETERYDTPELGNLKPGVGLLVRLQRPAEARRMDVVSPRRGGAFEVQGSPGADGRRPVYGRGEFTGGQVRVPLRVPRPDAVYVLWITRLPDQVDGRYRARVSEVSVLGPAN
jgi:serine/threonine-protein kinase